MFKDKRFQEIAGIVFILSAIIVFLALVSFKISDYALLVGGNPVDNIIGPLGAGIAHGLRSALGLSSFFIPAIFALAGWSTLKKGSPAFVLERIFSLFFLSVTTASAAGMVFRDVPQISGGYAGCGIASLLSDTIGTAGAALVIIILNMAGLILLGAFSMTSLLKKAAQAEQRLKIGNVIFGFLSGSRLFKFVKRTPQANNVPLNTIGKIYGEETAANRSKKRPPWITKETVLVTKGRFGLPVIKSTIAKSAQQLIKLPNFSAPIPAAVGAASSGINSAFSPAGIKDAVPVYGSGAVKVEAGEPLQNEDEEIIFSAAERFVEAEEQSEDFAESALPQNAELQSENQEAFNTESTSVGLYTNRISLDEEDSESCAEAERENQPYTEEEVNEELPDREKINMARNIERVFDVFEIKGKYSVPADFLNSSAPLSSDTWKEDIKRHAAILIKTLAEFGVEAELAAVNRGPVITRYEIKLAAGTPVNRVVNLSDNLAMALAALSVRVVAPIPGKSTVGIELPNKLRETVTLGDIIKSRDYKESSGYLKVALGKDISGKPVTLDLKRQPHLLIAGATGSGKSVCVNTIVSSLIYNYDPNYVRFIMVDPKMVELQLYNGMPHLLTPVITEPQMTPSVLKWAIYEMERRYRLLASMNTRDIQSYNEKIKESKSGEEVLPYIVIIIDELADLMMVAAKEIEGSITRLAQKARAIGVHLVLATQRPSVDVITGTIKANFPARIAFQVAQKNDSRTIIDRNGAEKLLGQGDMLYLSPSSSFPRRIQGAFISEEEISRTVEYLEKYGEPVYIDIEQAVFNASDAAQEGNGCDDELFVEALNIVEESRKASASYLQRRLSIGYNRAARIIELMEERGYIGPQQGSKPREIYI